MTYHDNITVYRVYPAGLKWWHRSWRAEQVYTPCDGARWIIKAWTRSGAVRRGVREYRRHNV